MLLSVFQLLLCSLVPASVAFGFYLLNHYTRFKDLNYYLKQVIIGVAFGGVAIFGTECGVVIAGATANVRDAAPLLAGLVFGGPAGIIAGVIGGVERFCAAYWGRGTFSQWSCSVSTVIAGLYAALLRKYLFKNSHPSPLLGFFIGGIMEVLHLSLVFIFRLNYPERALEVVKGCAIPMILANSFAVFLPILGFKHIHLRKEKNIPQKPKSKAKSLPKIMQLTLLVVMVIGYIGSTTCVFIANQQTAESNSVKLLNSGLDDLESVVVISTEVNMSSSANKALTHYEENPTISLSDLAEEYDVTEISIVDKYGEVTKSSDKNMVGVSISGDSILKTLNRELTTGGQNEYFLPFQQMTLKIPQHQNAYWKYMGLKNKAKGGYILFGYNDNDYETAVGWVVDASSSYRHIGQGGNVMVANRDKKVIAGYWVGKNLDEIGIKVNGVNPRTKTYCDFAEDPTKLDTKTAYYFMYETAEKDSFYVITNISSSEIYYSRDLILYVASFTQILAYAILFLLLYVFVDKAIISKIETIDKAMTDISDGKLDTCVKLTRPSREFEILADGINQSVETLKNINAKEFEFAKRIQLSALPNVFPAFPKNNEFDIYATMDTAKEVGGDFYDFFLIDDSHLCFLIADVSGKGVPAAMFMMESKTMLKNLASTGIPANEILEKANDGLCASNEAGMFVTTWLGIIDIKTGHVDFANGGHNPPLIYRKKTGWEYLKQTKNLVLGGLDGVKYELQSLDLNKGDMLYLYTDGVTEATRADGALFGEERLLTILNDKKRSSLNEILSDVTNGIHSFVLDAPQSDDITMLGFIYKGN